MEALSKAALDVMKQVKSGLILLEVYYYGASNKGKTQVKEVFILNL